MLCSLATGISAFYDVSVRRLTGLPLASFRPFLAGLLLLASGYSSLGSNTFEPLDAGSTTGDFHPMSSRLGWAYTRQRSRLLSDLREVQKYLRLLNRNVSFLLSLLKLLKLLLHSVWVWALLWIYFGSAFIGKDEILFQSSPSRYFPIELV
jgi:hypothetical protein